MRDDIVRSNETSSGAIARLDQVADHVGWAKRISKQRHDPDRPMPVELLRDGRGIYGIGVSDWFDDEAICWSCGIEFDPCISVGDRAPPI
jgi:hypothetical protein